MVTILTNRQGFNRLLLLCGIIAPAVLVVSILIAASLTPGYSHVADTVSQLAAQGRPHPEAVITGFILYALLIVAFTCGIYRQMGPEIHAKLMFLFLVVHSAGFILLALFRNDQELPDKVVTTQGILHDLFSGIAFIGLVLAMLVIAKLSYRNPKWTAFFWFTIVIVSLNCILPVLFWLELAVSIEGLIQRSFYTLSLLWLALLSLHLLWLSRNSRPWFSS